MPHDKTCCHRWCRCNKFDSIKSFSVKFYIVHQKRWERFYIKKVKTPIQKQFDLVTLFSKLQSPRWFPLYYTNKCKPCRLLKMLSWSLGWGHLLLTNIIIFFFIFWVSYEILALYTRNTAYEIRMRKDLYDGLSDITFLTSFPTQSQLSSLLPIAHHTWNTQTIYALH